VQTAKVFSEVMTIEQLAEYLQFDRAAADALVRTGTIKNSTIGNNVRIKKKDVDAYLGV
jgi:excisionase family DNA binding protein